MTEPGPRARRGPPGGHGRVGGDRRAHADGRPGGDRRLVVLRALGLGDLLTAVPALRALRRCRPEHRIILAAPGALAGLAARTGAVDEVLPTAGLAGPLDTSLDEPDLAVNLHGRGPQSTLLLQALRPARLVSYTAAVGHCDGPRWDDGEHEVARWCRLVAPLGGDPDPADLALDIDPLDSGRAAVVHPGAGSEARRWPAERFAKVVRHLLDQGRRVVVTGGRDELDLARQVIGLAGAEGDGCCACFAGATDLTDLAGLLAGASLLVSGDTGPGHLATAVGCPSVLLFGPTSPSEWGPPPTDRHRVLWAGRTGDPHGTEPDAGLLEIDVGQVLDAVDEAVSSMA